jgi:hypothetical protein
MPREIEDYKYIKARRSLNLWRACFYALKCKVIFVILKPETNTGHPNHFNKTIK